MTRRFYITESKNREGAALYEISEETPTGLDHVGICYRGYDAAVDALHASFGDDIEVELCV